MNGEPIDNETSADLEKLRWAEGMFVGSLTLDEIDAFGRLVKAGLARRSYEGVGGFMGLAKVRFL